MSDPFYTDSAEVLQDCQAHKDDLSYLFDFERGFAPQMHRICYRQMAALERDGMASQEEVEALRLECNTWSLLQTLWRERKQDPPTIPPARTLLTQNPFTPTKTLMNSIISNSPILSELSSVKEWLYDTAPDPGMVDAADGYWRFTKHRIVHALRTRSETGNVVRCMDPDAPEREDRAIAAEDAAYENQLVRTLYAHVRKGDFESAYEQCTRARQSWRAASLRGAEAFSWPAISNLSYDPEKESEDPKGNRRRALWKAACTRAALDIRLPDSERALYAALAPSSQTSTTLESACRTWEDILWARISVLLEEKGSAELEAVGGSVWERERGIPPVDVEEEDGEDEEMREARLRDEVYEELASLNSVAVDDGAPADHPFRISQLHIILNKTPHLLTDFATRLSSHPLQIDTSSPQYPSLTRFFAHLCLFMRMADEEQHVSPFVTQVILEAYLGVLEREGQRGLIAMYAGALGDNAVDRYAHFLAGLELSLDRKARGDTLADAAKYGLDTVRVAEKTAELTVQRALEALGGGNFTGDSLPDLDQTEEEGLEESGTEEMLFRAIEWTTFGDEMAGLAVRHVCLALRYFLNVGKVSIARRLYQTYQSLSPPPASNSSATSELQAYITLFNAWEVLARARAHADIMQMQLRRESRAQSVHDYRKLVDRAREVVVEDVLQKDWAVLGEEEWEGDAVPDRQHLLALHRLRLLYIPSLLTRLHTTLLASRPYIPENVKHALQLANVVADERYGIYLLLSEMDGALEAYLDGVGECLRVGVEGGGGDVLRVVRARRG
ncbi:unnamed protein product [Peniophora sp. CBMAI 1063]|nr:unnamed protein product [Peniophora sp. CBMAI 1063]